LIDYTAQRADWAIGFQDETWWSRLIHLCLHSWGTRPLKLVELIYRKNDSDPKASACCGVDIRWQGQEDLWLRFVSGNPKSVPTIQFLQWVLEKATRWGIQVPVMFWDNASWHNSQMVSRWIRQHNRTVKQAGTRLLAYALSKKSP